MNILNIYGGSLDGSSAAIANRFLEKARLLGAQVQSFKLNDATITTCKECKSCKTTTDGCVVQDDITPIFDYLIRCDVLVLSTGVFAGKVTENMSIFESRLFSFLKPDYEKNPHPSRLPPGKKLVFIQTQWASKDWHTNLYKRFEVLFRNLGFSDIFVIHADYINKPDDLQERSDILQLAEEIAEKIVCGCR